MGVQMTEQPHILVANIFFSPYSYGGATIVAETIIGLIELDERSWLGANRNWRPGHRSDDPAVELSSVGHLMTYT